MRYFWVLFQIVRLFHLRLSSMMRSGSLFVILIISICILLSWLTIWKYQQQKLFTKSCKVTKIDLSDDGLSILIRSIFYTNYAKNIVPHQIVVVTRDHVNHIFYGRVVKTSKIQDYYVVLVALLNQSKKSIEKLEWKIGDSCKISIDISDQNHS